MTSRSGQVVRSCARLVSSIRGVSAAFEPPIEGTPALRNDLRLTVLANSPVEAVEIDVSHVHLAGPQTDPPPAPALARAPAGPLASLLRNEAAALIPEQLLKRHLEKISKVQRFPTYLQHHHFRPIILSSGGIFEESSLGLVKTWMASAPLWVRPRFWQDISIIIVRCRALSTR